MSEDDKTGEDDKAGEDKKDSWVTNRKNPFVEAKLSLQFPSKEEDFYPAGSVVGDAFDLDAGPLRKQILDNGNVFLPMDGYRKLRPAMKMAFAAVSRDGTDNGWIASLGEFTQLMRSVGECTWPQATVHRSTVSRVCFVRR